MQLLISEDVNIDICPGTDGFRGITNATIGDMHGNAVKLLFFLVQQSVCQLHQTAYQRLVDIYKTPTRELSAQLLAEFNRIIAAMPILNRKVLLRLMGDELCDRGSNDYFTLKILEKLHQEDVPVEILISNHGLGFIEAYETRDRFAYERLGELFAASLYNLQLLIDRKLVTRAEVLTLTNNAYKPLLKAVSYTLDLKRNRITIFSHAAIDLNDIKSLAATLKVTFADGSIIELAQTIDAINAAFMTYVESDKVHTLYDATTIGADMFTKTPKTNPVDVITWNRDYSHMSRPASHNGYAVNFVHGHDATNTPQANVYVLDNMLGKSPAHHAGVYETMISKETLSVPKPAVNPPLAPAKKSGATDASPLDLSAYGLFFTESPIKSAPPATPENLLCDLAITLSLRV